MLSAYDEYLTRAENRSLGNGLWAVLLTVLLAPALSAWIARAVVFSYACTPSEMPCPTMPGILTGSLLKDLLESAWTMGANPMFALGLAFAAALAAAFAARPILASLTMLVAPIVALLLPIALVGQTAGYPGCAVTDATIDNCVLWGQSMGGAFQPIATAPQLLANYMPFVVVGGFVAGFLGWLALYSGRKKRRQQQPRPRERRQVVPLRQDPRYR